MYYFPIAIAEPPPRGSQQKWQMRNLVTDETLQFGGDTHIERTIHGRILHFWQTTMCVNVSHIQICHLIDDSLITIDIIWLTQQYQFCTWPTKYSRMWNRTLGHCQFLTMTQQIILLFQRIFLWWNDLESHLAEHRFQRLFSIFPTLGVNSSTRQINFLKSLGGSDFCFRKISLDGIENKIEGSSTYTK